MLRTQEVQKSLARILFSRPFLSLSPPPKEAHHPRVNYVCLLCVHGRRRRACASTSTNDRHVCCTYHTVQYMPVLIEALPTSVRTCGACMVLDTSLLCFPNLHNFHSCLFVDTTVEKEVSCSILLYALLFATALLALYSFAPDRPRNSDWPRTTQGRVKRRSWYGYCKFLICFLI